MITLAPEHHVPYKVGDEVICIRDHSGGLVKRGQIFRVLGLDRNPCCNNVIVDIGKKSNLPDTGCYTCANYYEKDDGRYWFASPLFRKLEYPGMENEHAEEVSAVKEHQKTKQREMGTLFSLIHHKPPLNLSSLTPLNLKQ